MLVSKSAPFRALLTYLLCWTCFSGWAAVLMLLFSRPTDSCYLFPADKPDPCADLKCPPGAKCIAAADASSATCQCPTKCSSYGDSVGSRPVCGADGKDYPNTCELHKSSCLANRRIDVKFQGACDPCASIECLSTSVCVLDSERKPHCRCGDTCPSDFQPVCGSDGRSYSSQCHLMQEACRSQRQLRILYKGLCESDFSNLPPDTKIKPTFHHLQVLKPEHEQELTDYLIVSQLRSHGLTPKKLKLLVYSYAVFNGIPVPPTWLHKKTAGKDWFSSFLKRNKRLSIRKPEATSQARAAALNKVVMNNFYDQVDELYEKHKFDADSVFNTDETNNTTVVEPAKIIAQKGTHQVYQMTSQERGVNVTMLPFVNASGKLFGGVFVFPRKKVSEKMKNLPEGFIALAHSSGWMTEENFLIALKHFHSQVQSRPTKEKPILLFLDNHISHMGYSICIFAKENGIILQTLPPHTSHASQPLDRTTFGPFKSNLADSHSDWMREHPGQRISIYEIPLLSKPALQRAFTEKNIKKGFKATGLFPFNRNAIPDSMYAPSIVTDLPAPTEVNSRQNGLTICNAIQHLPISVNQTLRFEMPSSIAAQHTTVATQEPPKSHYLLTVSSAGQLTLSPISVSPVAQPQAGPSSEIRSSSSTPIIQTEHERTTPTGSPSTINDMASTTASLPNQLSPQQLLTTPVKFREPHAFRPQDLLQLPQVAQNGPRNSNHNKRLGASRCLTSSPEIKRIREEHEEKERKLKAAENRKIAKATKAKAAEGKRKSNKVHSVEEDQYFETTPAVSNPQQGRKSTSRVLRYDKENVSSINLVEEEEDLPSEPRNSPVVPRRERITRAVKQNRMRNVCGR